MVAVGNGARASIEDQVVAAGMNVITVAAGNYKMKGEDGGGGVVDHQALASTRPSDDDPAYLAIAGPRRHIVLPHPEDDPMEKHNHPTARQRLGDAAAGLGSAATLTRADAGAIRKEVPASSTSLPASTSPRAWCSRYADGSPVSTAPKRICRGFAEAGYGNTVASSQNTNSSEASRSSCSALSHTRSCSSRVDPDGTKVRIWNQPFRVVGVIASSNWATTGAVGDDQFDAVYVPITAVHGLLNLTKLNTITITSRSAGETTRRVEMA